MPLQDSFLQGNKNHAVPQNIMDVEFKIIGDLTMRQFVYVFVFGLFAYFLTGLPLGLFKWPLVIFFALLGISLSFLPVQDRGLDVWLVNFLKSISRPTQMVWNKSIVLPPVFMYESINVLKQELITLAPTNQRRKLEEYLDYNKKFIKVDPLDINEEEYIKKVRLAFADTPVVKNVPEPVSIADITLKQPVITSFNKSTPIKKTPSPNLSSLVKKVFTTSNTKDEDKNIIKNTFISKISKDIANKSDDVNNIKDDSKSTLKPTDKIKNLLLQNDALEGNAVDDEKKIQNEFININAQKTNSQKSNTIIPSEIIESDLIPQTQVNQVVSKVVQPQTQVNQVVSKVLQPQTQVNQVVSKVVQPQTQVKVNPIVDDSSPSKVNPIVDVSSVPIVKPIVKYNPTVEDNSTVDDSVNVSQEFTKLNDIQSYIEKPINLPITPDRHSGRVFTSFLPSKGELILPIRGERVLQTSDEVAIEEDIKEKTQKLQNLIFQIRQSNQQLNQQPNQTIKKQLNPKTDINLDFSSPQQLLHQPSQNPNIHVIQKNQNSLNANKNTSNFAQQNILNIPINQFDDSQNNNIDFTLNNDVQIYGDDKLIKSEIDFKSNDFNNLPYSSNINNTSNPNNQNFEFNKNYQSIVTDNKNTSSINNKSITDNSTDEYNKVKFDKQKVVNSKEGERIMDINELSSNNDQRPKDKLAKFLDQINIDKNKQNELVNMSIDSQVKMAKKYLNNLYEQRSIVLRKISDLKNSKNKSNNNILIDLHQDLMIINKQYQSLKQIIDEISIYELNVSKPTNTLISDIKSLNQVKANFAPSFNKPNVIWGFVKDSLSKPIKNIVVVVKNSRMEPIRATKTNDLGQFTLSAPLSNGEYFLSVSTGSDFTEKFDTISIVASGNVIPPVELMGRQ